MGANPAQDRHAPHQRTRHRIRTDLGDGGAALNQKLTAWWELDFAGFRVELRKALRREIPVAERDEWETLLLARRGEHERLTGRMVALETELNDRVYRLIDLTAEEIRIIEETTKYRYGEV